MTTKQAFQPNLILGLSLMMLFCVVSVLADGIVKMVTVEGVPFTQVIFARGILGSLMLLPFVINQPHPHISRSLVKLHLLRAGSAFLGISSWFYILQYTNFSAIIAISFTAPLFTVLLAVFLLKESINRTAIFMLIAGFVGALIVIQPWDVDFNPYYIIGLLSAFAWAYSLVVTKQLTQLQSPLQIAFYYALMLVPLSGILGTFYNWQMPSTTQFFYLAFFAVLATIAQVSLTYAFRYAELSVLMPLEYSKIIIAALFGYIVFGELITWHTLLGGAIILFSGYVVVRSYGK